MPYGSYVNKVRKHTCPYCGIERNLDWFIKDSEACWKCRETKKNEKEGKRGEHFDDSQIAR